MTETTALASHFTRPDEQIVSSRILTISSLFSVNHLKHLGSARVCTNQSSKGKTEPKEFGEGMWMLSLYPISLFPRDRPVFLFDCGSTRRRESMDSEVQRVREGIRGTAGRRPNSIWEWFDRRLTQGPRLRPFQETFQKILYGVTWQMIKREIE